MKHLDNNIAYLTFAYAPLFSTACFGSSWWVLINADRSRRRQSMFGQKLDLLAWWYPCCRFVSQMTLLHKAEVIHIHSIHLITVHWANCYVCSIISVPTPMFDPFLPNSYSYPRSWQTRMRHILPLLWKWFSKPWYYLYSIHQITPHSYYQYRDSVVSVTVD